MEGIREQTKSQLMSKKDLCVLIIMDGLGVRTPRLGNAVLQAQTPVLDSLWSNCPSGLLLASGEAVGLGKNDPGNSEACHLTIGTGHASPRSLPRINKAIKEGKFGKLPELTEMMTDVNKNGGDLHLMGILSSAGVHGHIQHLFELMNVCKESGVNPYIHISLDGRDSGLHEGYAYVNLLLGKIQELGIGRIASICGRKFSMDRDEKWERTELAYNAMVGNGLRKSDKILELVEQAYEEGENDQIFTPTTIVDENNNPVGNVKSGDSVIFYNFREDRARQITKAFVQIDLPYFVREPLLKDVKFLTMTSYQDDLPVKVLFEPSPIQESVSSLLSKAGLSQLHISETEKFAHVTYFFNGGEENPHENEVFIKIPSPDVFDYAEVPEMSSVAVTDEVIKGIDSGKYNFVIVNLANPDMLGHTGNLASAIESVEITDTCVGRILESVDKRGGVALISADHGCCEKMINKETGEVDTAHTSNPVPVSICCGDCIRMKSNNLNKVGTGVKANVVGTIADLGVTVLKILGVEVSEDMDGKDLRKTLI